MPAPSSLTMASNCGGTACFSGRSTTAGRRARNGALRCVATTSWNGEAYQAPRGYTYYTVDKDLGAPKQETNFPAPRGYKYYEMHPVQPSVSSQFVHIPYPHVQFTGVDANLSSPLLLLAVALSGIYTAGAAVLGFNYDATTFQKDKKLQMVAFWPALFSASTNFREQFARAIVGTEAAGEPRPKDLLP